MDLPLGDIRVIDLTVARAGPTCVRPLAAPMFTYPSAVAKQPIGTLTGW